MSERAQWGKIETDQGGIRMAKCYSGVDVETKEAGVEFLATLDTERRITVKEIAE